MQVFLFFLKYLVILIGFLWVTYLIGVGILDLLKVKIHNVDERFVIAVTTGMGILAAVIFFLGLAGLINRWAIGTAVIALALLGSKHVFSTLIMLRKMVYGFRKLHLVYVILLVILTLAIFSTVFVLALYPPTAHDATAYHLAYAKSHILNGRIKPVVNIRFPVFPQYVEMLFLLMMLFTDEIATQIVSFSMLLVTCITIYILGKRLSSETAGFWGGAIFLSNPLVIWLGVNSYVDIGLTLFVTISFLALLLWIENKNERSLVLVGMLGGFLGCIKYTGLFFVVILCLIVLITSIKERNLRHFIYFMFIVAIIVAPTYLYIMINTGNPVWPFLSNIFGFWLWDESDLQGMYITTFQKHGAGKSLLSFLQLPWNFFFNFELFEGAAPVSKFLFFLIPFQFYSFYKRKRIVEMSIFSSYLLYWFFSAQVNRYLIPIFPIFSLMVAEGLFLTLQKLVSLDKIKSRIITVVMFIVILSPGLYYVIEKINEQNTPPVSEDQRNEYLSRYLPTYNAYNYLNSFERDDYKIYALFDENMMFYADGDFLGDWFGPYRFQRINGLADGSEEELIEQLRMMEADYFLINLSRSGRQFQENWLHWRYLRPVLGNHNFVLFKLSGTPLCVNQPIEFVENGGFEKVIGPNPEGWYRVGEPLVSPFQISNEDTTSVVIHDYDNYFYYSTAILGVNHPMYLLSVDSRKYSSNQEAIFNIDWRDDDEKSLFYDFIYFQTTSEWKHYSMLISTEESASKVYIFPRGFNGSTILFDNLSLKAIEYEACQ